MPKYRSRATLQAGRRLDINELRRSGVRTGEFGVSFPGDGAAGTLNVHMEEGGGSWLRVRLPPNVDQTFTLVPAKRPFGGHQWYFVCSLSGYRASVLWKPPGARMFACQRYWRRRAAYASQFLTPTDRAIENGRVNQANLRREMLTEEELRSQLREKEVEAYEEVKLANLEGDGRLSVIKINP